MNKTLKQKAEEVIKREENYFKCLKYEGILSIYLSQELSSFGYYNEDNEIIEGKLFLIFIYLYNNNYKNLEKALTNQDTKKDLYKNTLKVINKVINDITLIDDLYEDIIAICNTMTQKLYNIYYAEFLLNYINKKFN